MSKLRNLTQVTSLGANDLFYVVLAGTNPNGGRYIIKSDLLSTLVPDGSVITFDPTGTDLVATEIDAAIRENDGRITTISSQLDNFKDSFLQYTNDAVATNATTTYAAIALNGNQSSSPQAEFDKSSSTDFKTLFNGVIEISFKVNGYTDTNDRGLGVRINQNGSAITWTLSQVWGKNLIERSGTASGHFLLPCSTNDIFQLRFAALEAGPIVTIPIGQAHMAMRVHRFDS